MRVLKKIKGIVGFSGKKKLNVRGNINYTGKFIFVHIPKNAGTSVYKALGFGNSYHTQAKEYKQSMGDVYNDFFSFCFVRNPFDRFVSTYNYARLDESYYHSSINPGKTIFGKHLDYDILKQATLEQAVDLLIEEKLVHDKTWNHWKPQTEWILDDQENVIIDYIGRVEDIRIDFQNISSILALPAGNHLSVLNASQQKKEDYRQLIHPAMREKLAWYYRKDIELLGYSFENNCGFK